MTGIFFFFFFFLPLLGLSERSTTETNRTDVPMLPPRGHLNRLTERTVRGSLHSRRVWKWHGACDKWDRKKIQPCYWKIITLSIFFFSIPASALGPGFLTDFLRLRQRFCGSSWRLWPGSRCVRKWPSATWCPARRPRRRCSSASSCLAVAEALWWGGERRDSLDRSVTFSFYPV